jgi:hemolysin III
MAKLTFWRLNARGSLVLYLGMGWLSVLLIWPMAQVLPWETVALILVGGLIYSAGTVVYAHPGMRYQFAIWHCFVLIASICLFMAVAFSLTGERPVLPVQMAGPL